MIEHVSIKNFATIKDTEVDFEDGLNIITGETGAGKSIVIEAISLALGQRADNSYVRHGEEKATIELLGSIDGEDVLIQREISNTGKNVCKLNGSLVTLQILNDKTHLLADIHGQYDNQSLLNPDNHIDILDSFKNKEILPLREEVSNKYKVFNEKKQALIKLLNLEKENKRKLDFYKYEIAEITNINPTIGEDELLEDRIKVLNNSEKIYGNLKNAYQALSGEENGTISSILNSSKELEEIATYSKELSEISDSLSESYYKLIDCEETLRRLIDNFTYSPKELDDSILRLNQLDNLKRKYGNSLEEVLNYKNHIEEEIFSIENFDEEKSKLESELITLNKDLLQSCTALSEKRKETANELSSLIEKELKDLNFNDAKILISIEKMEYPSEKGIDKVEILITTNLGEPLKPLHKIVSGGEMSRIMLAFKNIISSYDNIPTLIFDEIDTGISGETASVVSKKLKDISRKHQIICITHLPQIAANGDYNYSIIKANDKEKTYTEIRKLKKEEKIKEIARLMSGNAISDITLKNAEELINSF